MPMPARNGRHERFIEVLLLHPSYVTVLSDQEHDAHISDTHKTYCSFIIVRCFYIAGLPVVTRPGLIGNGPAPLSCAGGATCNGTREEGSKECVY